MDKKGAIRTGLMILLVFIVYLAFLGAMNIISHFYPNLVFSEMVSFLNGSILIAFLIAVVFFLISMFYSMKYPYNLPAPVFAAVNITMICWIILELLSIANYAANLPVLDFLKANSLKVYGLIAAFFVVLGYILLIRERYKE